MKNILFLSLLFLSITMTNGQSNLRYNLDKGDLFTIKQDVKQETNMQIEGQEQKILNDMSATFLFEVTDTASDNYVIDMSFTSISMTVSVGGAPMMSVDTDSESNDSTQAMFKGMLDKKVTMYMKPNGKIVDVKNGENIVNGMLEAMGDLDPSVEDQIRKGLDKEYSGKTLANSFEQMTYFYPSISKSINDTWENKYVGEGKLNATNKWKYISENKDARVLEATSSVTMDIDSGQILMNLAGEQKTMAKVDPTSGFLKEIIVNTTTSGSSHFTQLPDDKKPTTLKMTTTYTLQ